MKLPIYINYPDNIFSFQRAVIRFLNTTKNIKQLCLAEQVGHLYTVPLMAQGV